MEILIFSDSHGRSDKLRAAIEKCGNFDEILFLGDGLRDIEALPEGNMSICVRGNCDMFGADDYPTERILRFGEYTVMMTHGHTYSVKSALERAAQAASARGADMLIFGHTHIRTDIYLPEGSDVGGVILPRPLRLFNPGSIKEGSFGRLTLKNNAPLTSFGEV